MNTYHVTINGDISFSVSAANLPAAKSAAQFNKRRNGWKGRTIVKLAK